MLNLKKERDQKNLEKDARVVVASTSSSVENLEDFDIPCSPVPSNVDDESDFLPSSPEKKDNRISQGQTINIDRDVIAESFRAAVSMDVSSHKMTAILTKLVTAAGGDPEKLPLSYTSAFRMKENLITKDAEALKDLITREIQSKDSKIQLHFDGKMIKVAKHISVGYIEYILT